MDIISLYWNRSGSRSTSSAFSSENGQCIQYLTQPTYQYPSLLPPYWPGHGYHGYYSPLYTPARAPSTSTTAPHPTAGQIYAPGATSTPSSFNQGYRAAPVPTHYTAPPWYPVMPQYSSASGSLVTQAAGPSNVPRTPPTAPPMVAEG